MAVVMPPASDRRSWLATKQSDRRVEPRADTSLVATLRVYDGQEMPVVVLDLSSTGALLETSSEPRFGGVYTITFTMYGEAFSTPLHVVRSVKHGDAYLWGCKLSIRLRS